MDNNKYDCSASLLLRRDELMPLFKKGKLRQEKKLELANQLDQRNKTSTKRRLKARAKLRIRVERNGDFGIGP